jgi:predicted RNA binding protein YcfA (HicA-like mRNA interferase family)
MKFPSDVKPKDAVRVLEAFGFQKHKNKGSHIHFRHPDGRWTQVAVHPKPIPMGTLRKILNQAEITPEEFRKLL